MTDGAKTMLFVSPAPRTDPRGGRASLGRLTRDVLAELRPGMQVLQLPRPGSGASARMAALRGHIDGVDHASIQQVLAEVERLQVRDLVLDGSNLGALAHAAKQRFPAVRVITLFHNVESRFFLGSLRQERSLRALGVLVANHGAERLAVRASDVRVCLSTRDSDLLRKVHGRPATHVVPLALRDRQPAAPPAAARGEGYLLFVGGSFYANRAGIEWFASEVAPRSPLETLVVGHGFDELRPRLEIPGKLKVVGAVDDVAPLYADAIAVVAPIFDGSGMKTKVAEAFMFGKPVLGTPDAFVGYDAVPHGGGIVCTDADDFVEAIVEIARSARPAFDERLRRVYDEHHSFAAAKAAWAIILDQEVAP